MKNPSGSSTATSGSDEGPAILRIDPWLRPYERDLRLRMERYGTVRHALLGPTGSFRDFANGHHHFGFHRTQDGWIYREWAPAADALFLLGDFNGWNRASHPLTRGKNGTWEIFLQGADALSHLSRVKVHVVSKGIGRDRISPWIRKCVQDPQTHDFSGQIWSPAEPYAWSDADFHPDPDAPPFIYETHVGMAQEKEALGTYREFAETTLPRIRDLGYNTVQIMAVMEHPYYASFGYHVSNFFAASSWFGTPDDLKYLIDTAHGMGIRVLMDIVQSHAVKNLAEGINEFDGTERQFFHAGKRGTHSAWDSKLFNYGKHEVIHFLLSNVKFWMEEYHFDGFRFDGITSMIYQDHGLGTAFDNYGKYFGLNTDVDALTYLQFATELIREMNPDALAIAEDMSGMPGMCLPVSDGGIGFDYRLAMGMPDFWVNTAKQPDENWDLHRLWHELSTARPQEKRIGYVESHDQALVGDKTFMFRLADKDMYWHMDKGSQSLVIDRAVALHKMVRLATASLGSEGYLTFMGNEFGHPEWIDFPREGNNWSFQHCRRQWSLAENPFLRYGDLNRFEGAMVRLLSENRLMGDCPRQLWLDEKLKLLAYRKGGFVFLFNLHPTMSQAAFELPLHEDGTWQVVLDTDEERFGGQARIAHDMQFATQPLSSRKRDTGIILYAPCRTAMVLRRL